MERQSSASPPVENPIIPWESFADVLGAGSKCFKEMAATNFRR